MPPNGKYFAGLAEGSNNCDRLKANTKVFTGQIFDSSVLAVTTFLRILKDTFTLKVKIHLNFNCIFRYYISSHFFNPLLQRRHVTFFQYF